MTREEARKAAEVMMAYAEGKEIEFSLKNNDCWEVCLYPLFDWDNYKYRIKQKIILEYRPFKNAEECWNEMLKHQPFGWIKDTESGIAVLISSVSHIGKDVLIGLAIGNTSFYNVSKVFNNYIFADGTPFGIKEE